MKIKDSVLVLYNLFSVVFSETDLKGHLQIEILVTRVVEKKHAETD